MDKTKQAMQKTGPERETRKQDDFKGTEKSLAQHGARSRLSNFTVSNLSSYLGGHNPLAKDVDPANECVWLIDNTAYRPVHMYPHAPQPWQAEFLAACFLKNTGQDVSKAVAVIADKMGFNKDGKDDSEAQAIIASRLQRFVHTIAPARSVNITFPNGTTTKLGPGGRSAISQQTFVLGGNYKDGDSIEVSAVNSDVTLYGPMTTHFAAPEGWAVISDIDDSIKITMTPSPVGILQSTFIDEPAPILGMPELYKKVAETVNPAWFYLSASPYNLYPFLREFLHKYYAPGPIFLRTSSWMDLAGFLASLTQGTEAYKRDRMVNIHDWLPKRKILCVGDSTQTDPEAYGDICRMYKGWVKAVFIRKVVDVAEMKDTDKNNDERFQKAFRDVPQDVWRTFEDPKELYEAVEALKDL